MVYCPENRYSTNTGLNTEYRYLHCIHHYVVPFNIKSERHFYSRKPIHLRDSYKNCEKTFLFSHFAHIPPQQPSVTGRAIDTMPKLNIIVDRHTDRYSHIHRQQPSFYNVSPQPTNQPVTNTSALHSLAYTLHVASLFT